MMKKDQYRCWPTLLHAGVFDVASAVKSKPKCFAFIFGLVPALRVQKLATLMAGVKPAQAGGKDKSQRGDVLMWWERKISYVDFLKKPKEEEDFKMETRSFVKLCFQLNFSDKCFIFRKLSVKKPLLGILMEGFCHNTSAHPYFFFIKLSEKYWVITSA